MAEIDHDAAIALVRGWAERVPPKQRAKYVYVAALAERAKKLEEALRKIANPANYGEDGCWDADSYPPEIALAALEKKP